MSYENPIINFCLSVSEFCKGFKDNAEAEKMKSLTRIIKLREELKEKERILRNKNMEAYKKYELCEKTDCNNRFDESHRGYIERCMEENRLECLIDYLDRAISDSDNNKKYYRY